MAGHCVQHARTTIVAAGGGAGQPFNQLTNTHSKSLKHHKAMQAIFFAWYNWCRKNESINNQTPAMASGLTEKVWTIRELLDRAALLAVS
jgi:hypothetical protein